MGSVFSREVFNSVKLFNKAFIQVRIMSILRLNDISCFEEDL